MVEHTGQCVLVGLVMGACFCLCAWRLVRPSLCGIFCLSRKFPQFPQFRHCFPFFALWVLGRSTKCVCLLSTIIEQSGKLSTVLLTSLPAHIPHFHIVAYGDIPTWFGRVFFYTSKRFSSAVAHFVPSPPPLAALLDSGCLARHPAYSSQSLTRARLHLFRVLIFTYPHTPLPTHRRHAQETLAKRAEDGWFLR